MFLGIENDYKGPQLEDGKVTLEFMESLMELYKNEGKLHRKYAYKVPQELLQSLPKVVTKAETLDLTNKPKLSRSRSRFVLKIPPI